MLQRRPSGLPGRARCCGDLADPDAVRWRGARRAGRRRAPGREGRRGRAVAGVRRGPTSAAPAPVARGLPARPAWAGSCTCRRRRWPTRARAGRRRRRAGRPGPGPRPLRPQQGRWPSRSRWPRDARPGPRRASRVRPAPGLGARRHPARRPDRRAGPGRAGCPSSAPGAALIDTTYVDNAVDALVAALDRARGRCTARRSSCPTASRGRSPRCSRGSAPRPARPARAARARAGARLAGAAVERRRSRSPAPTTPPMTRFLAEQLATAHWFDQRRHPRGAGLDPPRSASTRASGGWAPEGWTRPVRDRLQHGCRQDPSRRDPRRRRADQPRPARCSTAPAAHQARPGRLPRRGPPTRSCRRSPAGRCR